MAFSDDMTGLIVGEIVSTVDSFLKFRGLDKAREDLQKRGINIEELAVVGNGSLRDVLHPTTVYKNVERILSNFSSRPSGETRCYLLGFQVSGESQGYFWRKNFDFEVVFKYTSFSPPFLKRISGVGITIISTKEQEIFESYLHQRMEAQQPQYNYTYRSRTEIK